MGRRKKYPAHQWHPPEKMEAPREPFFGRRTIASATECTGLVPSVPGDHTEAEAISSLYAIHRQKPQTPPYTENVPDGRPS